jgi:hypothetical protein
MILFTKPDNAVEDDGVGVVRGLINGAILSVGFWAVVIGGFVLAKS